MKRCPFFFIEYVKYLVKVTKMAGLAFPHHLKIYISYSPFQILQ